MEIIKIDNIKNFNEIGYINNNDIYDYNINDYVVRIYKTNKKAISYSYHIYNCRISKNNQVLDYFTTLNILNLRKKLKTNYNYIFLEN